MKIFLRLAFRTALVLTRWMPGRLVFWLLNQAAPKLVRFRYSVGQALVQAGFAKYRNYASRKFGAHYIDCADVPLGYKMCIPVSDNHYAHRKFGVYHSVALLETVKRLCPVGATVCELGPHLGEMTLYIAKQVGNRGEVYVFEIDDLFCKILQKSLDTNGYHHVKLENKAVGKPGRVPVGDGYGDIPTMMANFPELNYASSLGTQFFTEDKDAWNKAEIPKSEHISVERIDLYDYFKVLNCNVDAFFMDIEGCEVYAIPMVLELAQHYGRRPKIIFEVHHNAYSSEQVWSLRNRLLKVGYRMSSPDDRHVVCE